MSAGHQIIMPSVSGRKVMNCGSHAIVYISVHPEPPLRYQPQTRSELPTQLLMVLMFRCGYTLAIPG